MNLYMKGMKKITDLEKKVDSDDLIYRYKGNTSDVKFDKFDNALNIINKIQNGEINVVDVKIIKRNLNVILEKKKKETKNIN